VSADVPCDEAGRFVWLVTWGRPGRVDWLAVLALAHDPDAALAAARQAYPDRLPPDEAFLASAPTAQAVLDGSASSVAGRLPVIE
jgi:hypothetical protein